MGNAESTHQEEDGWLDDSESNISYSIDTNIGQEEPTNEVDVIIEHIEDEEQHEETPLLILYPQSPTDTHLTNITPTTTAIAPPLILQEGFNDDPPPYYIEDSGHNELPTYQELVETSRVEQEATDWVERCSGCIISVFFFMLVIAAGILTILPLALGDADIPPFRPPHNAPPPIWTPDS